jgi:serine/threonine protein kinase
VIVNPRVARLKLEREGSMIKLKELKITDFGVSRYLDNPHNEVERPMTQGMGTTGYISPETAIGMQLKDDELWLKSDGTLASVLSSLFCVTDCCSLQRCLCVSQCGALA